MRAACVVALALVVAPAGARASAAAEIAPPVRITDVRGEALPYGGTHLGGAPLDDGSGTSSQALTTASPEELTFSESVEIGPAAGSRQLIRLGEGLWSTDGTREDFALLSPHRFWGGVSVGDRALLRSAEPDELWITDGTAAGTVPFAVDPAFEVGQMSGLGDFALVRTLDGLGQSWITDGTVEGSRGIGPIGRSTLGCEVVRLGDRVVGEVLLWEQGIQGSWSFSISTDDREILTDAYGLAVSCSPAVSNDLLYTAGWVRGEDGSMPWTLMRSDGTAAGTETLPDVVAVIGDEFVWPIGALGGVVLLNATTHNELWRTDGTVAGTSLLVPANDGAVNWEPYAATTAAFAGLFFFAYDDGVHGAELWRSDGTPDGTALVADLYAGPFGGAPKDFVVADGVLYFTACTESGCEPWLSDGTTDGTRLWADIIPGSGGSDPSELQKTGGRVYFTAYDGDARQVFVPEPASAWLAAIALASIAALAQSLARRRPSEVRRIGVMAGVSALAMMGAPGARALDLAPPVQITDEPRSIVASVPRDLARAGALVFFQARTPDLGEEPWVTDGTAEGTHLVRDVWPGSGSGRLDFLAVIDDRLLFSAANPDRSIDVWSSDGTSDGTRVLVASAGRAGDFSGPRSATLWVGAQRRVGIRGDSGDVWLTDGTPEGTVAMDPSEADWYLAAAGDTVFTYRSGAGGVRTLRRFDLATPQGVSIATFPAWNGTLTGAALGGVLYFTGYDAAHGVELWRSDGTEGGTWRVTDLVAGAASSSPSELTLYDGDLYFASARGSAATTRRELLRMDGVSGDVAPVSTAIASSAPHRIDALTVAGGRLYFVAYGSSQYGTWATDGSSDGTHQLASGGPWTAEEGELQRDVFFEAQGLVHWVGDDVLWGSDGTPEGTEALLQGGAAELQRLDTGFVVAGPTLRRVDLDGGDPVVLADFSSAVYGVGAWLGASAGTRQLYAASGGTWSTAGGAGDAQQVSPQSLGPSASLGERAVAALSSGSGWPSFAIWTTDGISFGTTALDLAEPGQNFTMPANTPTPFVSLGDRALLRLVDSLGAAGAWITDGTAEGSRSVGALGTSYHPCPVTRIGDHAIVHEIVYNVSDYDRVWGVPLEAGDPVVLPLLDRAFGCYPVVANEFLYTAASVEEEDSWYVTLVRTDGTVAGTEALGDVLPATGGFDLAPVGAIGDVVLFRTWPNGLWRTDGTAAGTAALHVAAGPESHEGPFSDAAIAFGGGLIFAYDDGVHGAELWRSDGTPDGTVLVADLYAGPFGGAPKSFVVADGALYFTACTESGCEPWLSDGTTDGTRLWADIIPGSGGSDPSELQKTGGRVYFTAYDGEARQVFVPEPASASLAAIALASIAALARRTRALR